MPATPPDAVGLRAKAQSAAPASSADLALLAAQLQTLAEEMGRLRLGLDRLLAISNAANRAGPDPGGLAPLREQPTSRTASALAGLCAASTAGRAGKTRGRALWVQERLLLEVQALLEEMMAGSQPPGPAGVLTSARLREGLAQAKNTWAASAAAAAAAPSSIATKALEDRTDQRSRRNTSWAGGLEQVHGEESARHNYHHASFSKLAEVGSDSLHCSKTGPGPSRRDNPAKILGGCSMAEMAGWDPGASPLGATKENDDDRQSRGGDGAMVDAGASDVEGAILREGERASVDCIASACDPCPMGASSQKPGVTFSFASSAPLPLGVRPDQLRSRSSDPGITPTRIGPFTGPAGWRADTLGPGASGGPETWTLGGGYGRCHNDADCDGFGQAIRQDPAGRRDAVVPPQPRLWPRPGGSPSISSAIEAEPEPARAGQGLQAGQLFVQAKERGVLGRPGDVRSQLDPTSLSWWGAAAPTGVNLAAESAAAAATRYCI
jgi:hypothetical protein